MKEIILRFGLILGKRFTDNQKKRFLDEVQSDFNNQNLQNHIYTVKQGYHRSNHLLVGDVEKAKTIIVAYYDTPSIALPLFDYEPLSIKAKLKTERKILILNTFLTLLTLYMTSGVLLAVLSIEQVWIRIIALIVTLLFIAIELKSFEGFANKINYNRNSAAIAVMISLAEYTKQNRFAMIFVDRACSSLKGYEQVINMEMINKKARFIILDSIAFGEDLYIAGEKHRDNIDVDHKYIETNSSCWISMFNDPMLIFCGESHEERFVVKNTRCFNDFKIDMDRLEKIRRNLVKIIERD